MSESEWYWPTENGKYLVNVREKYVEFLNLENGLWHSPANHELTFTTEHLRRCGYLGVRREPTPVNQAEQAEDNDTLAREAREELRMCRRSYEFERWAIKWGPVLCQMMGAE